MSSKPKLETKPEKSRRGRPAKISRERILREARQIPSTELTMPAVAKRLGVNPVALYYHFKSREALIIAVAADMATEFRPRAIGSADWREWLWRTACDLHRFIIANPILAATPGQWAHLGRLGGQLAESALEVLENAGVGKLDAGRIWSVVSCYVYLHATIFLELSKGDKASQEKIGRQQLGNLEQLPRIRALAEVLGKTNPKEAFDDNLRWLIQTFPEPKPLGSRPQSTKTARRRLKSASK
jgi:AcrR family transcriptional regulator